MGCSPACVRPCDLAAIIEPEHPSLSVARQSELLGLARRSYYYEPHTDPSEQARLKLHMNAVDAIYTDYPFYGSRRMKNELADRFGIDIGRERIRTVMGLLGLEAVYPSRIPVSQGQEQLTRYIHIYCAG